MAIDVFLQSIDGKRKQEAVDVDYSLARLWPCGDPRVPLLQYVDPYGNAVFNGLQMPQVRHEIEVLMEKASTDEQRDVLRRIHELTLICEQHPQTFLRFSGD